MDGIQEIKQLANIVDVIGAKVKLKKEGSNYRGLCPFHQEKTPSFTVSPAKSMYKCFGCGKSGDVISFVMEDQAKSFLDAVAFLCEKYGIEFTGPKKEYKKPEPRLEKLSKKLLDWFEKERGISNNTLLRMKITEAIEWMPKHEKEVPAICFNYYENEELVNIKFRGPQKTFKLAKDAKLILYNIDGIKDEKEAVIVEGEMDCLAAIESGIFNVLAVPNGTPPIGSKINLEYLDNCWQYFTGIQKIILAGDADEVGKNLREELARRLGKDRCWTVEYPEGCKDLNEVLLNHGKESVKECLLNAKQWPLDGIKSMDDIYPTVAEWYENGYPEGDRSQVPGFDDLLRFFPGFITTITGIPSHGKDEFTNGILAGLATKADWKIGICGFEESPEITTTKLAEKITGKSFDYRKDPVHRIHPRQLEQAIGIIDQRFFFYDTDEANTTIEGILSTAQELVLRHGINALYINPWNWIEHSRPNGMSETEYVSEAYTKLLRFARKFNCHVFIVAHTTKMQKDKVTKKYETPTLYNINGSANFYNKTSNGITVYRDFETGVVTVYVQKVKQSWMGEVGWSAYTYDTLTRQYNFFETSAVKSF